MNIDEFKERLGKYRKEDLVITNHADIQAYVREIDLEEVKENIIHPEKLVYVEEQGKERYGCYFAYSENYCHKYVLTMNAKIIIVTIISINRKWQGTIRK